MYTLYSRICENGKVTLVSEDQEHLAGCNSGVVAKELRKMLKPTDNPFMGWKIPVAEIYNEEGYAFVIDIKPNSEEVLLCELDTVFGYSYDEWSPIMLRLNILCTDEEVDKSCFEYPESKSDIIYTALYLNGSISNGKLVGKWTLARGTVTAVLFWPEAMTFFFEQVKLSDPLFLTRKIEMIESLR